MTNGIKKIDENVIRPERSLTITNPNLADNSNFQVGTLKCNPSVQGLTFKSNSSGNYSKFNAAQILLNETITSAQIKNGTILTEDLSNKCITNDKIADRTISNIKIQKNILTDEEMAAESISTRAIQRQAIVDNESSTVSKIAYRTILNRSLSDNCIQYRNMSSNSVGTIQLMDNSITTEKYGSLTITNDKLANDVVQWGKLAPHTIIGGENTEVTVGGQKTTVKGRIAQKTITNWNIKDGTINSANIMTGAIINRTIGDGEVYGTKIAPSAIETEHIKNRAIKSDHISIAGVDTTNYKDKSVTKVKLSDDVSHVVSNAVIYNETGGVNMIQQGKNKCDVVIGTGSVEGGTRRSNENGSLNVYGSIQADRVYNMAYADLAEGYVPGEDLKPGDAAFLREDNKVYKNGPCYVGIVSDEYAMCFGASESELKNKQKVAVALIGKVHVNVNTDVYLGSTVCINGVRIGRALETKELSKNKKEHKVLCLVKPL